ncbi:hypothetical protein EKL98_14850 [Flavobacterium bomense]|uniref:Condensation domain-containing protein n=1 Tax=Flavobacterium bomense TaxID=2497483 RepID=A0A3S0PFE9_9FLAO|nr:condensation domain-containing protein [Flavobacterium bomense]RTZ01740.1 hypothetical protein EKL98_14850 [Flavobacterium bomense]
MILKEFSQLNKSTLYSTILTILSVVLNSIYKQKIILGTVFSGRNYPQLEVSIGMFIKTLPYQLRVEESADLASLVKRSQKNFLLLEENMNIPFNVNLNSLTDFLLVYQHSDDLSKPIIDFGEFSLERKPMYFTQSRFPVVFNFYESAGLKCEIEYDENIDEKFLETIWEKITILTNVIYETPNKTIQEIDLSTLKERQLENMIHFSFDF